jgi:tRNA nucleotidyltransferase/poly(A) polymerase
MSDYMFMLDSHLSADQNRVLNQLQAAALEAGVNVFLTGGAMRDMLGGFPIRDLDFTVEGSPLKLAKSMVKSLGGHISRSDEHRKTVDIVFPGGVQVEIAMCRQLRYGKPGARPQVLPATMHEDLRSRDLTINAIALSLNRASRGLLLDPTNGLADLERKELRAIHNYAFYDEPVRMLRLLRLKARLGFAVDERTRLQLENARAAEMERYITPATLLYELHRIAEEPDPAEVLRALEEEKFLGLFSPALTGGKVNYAGLARLHKARQMVPFGADLRLEMFGLFLNILTEKWTPKENAALVKQLAMPKEDIELWQKLDARSKKLDKEMKSPKLQKPSQIYRMLVAAPGDQVLYLLLRSEHRLVQDRIRNFLQKYLPTAQEITERELAAAGVQPGSPRYQKVREELITVRLDSRPKKVAPPAEPEPVTTPPPGPRAIMPARR